MSTCYLCESQKVLSRKPIAANADGHITLTYEVLICADCGLNFTFPLPSAEVLSEKYKTGIYAYSGGRAFPLIDLALNFLQGIRVHEIRRHVHSGRLLDVGCGKGRFLYTSQSKGWKVEGIETSISQAEHAKKRYGLNVHVGELTMFRFPNNAFDVVTTWHVLEHVPDPKAFMGEMVRILKPGGVLALEVPNMDSWQSTIGDYRWFLLDVPRHLSHFTPVVLKRLGVDLGLRLIKKHTFSLELGLFGMLQSLLNRIGFPQNFLFTWLKRCSIRKSTAFVIFHSIVVTFLIPPTLILEGLAAILGRGGVLRILFVKETPARMTN